MKNILPIITLVGCIPVLALSQGSKQVADSYCIKLKPASHERFFSVSRNDSLQEKVKPSGWMIAVGQMMSRFGEEALVDSNRLLFRTIDIPPYGNPADIQIRRIEKREQGTEIIVKILRPLRKPTRKNPQPDTLIEVATWPVSQEQWSSFENQLMELFVNRPTYLNKSSGVLDGSSTIFEGMIKGQYHFVYRHVVSLTDPELLTLQGSMTKMMAGGFFECDEVREK